MAGVYANTGSITDGTTIDAADVKVPVDALDTQVALLTFAGGRLTCTSGTSITTADALTITTLYYTPSELSVHPNLLTLWDSAESEKRTIAFTETSLSLASVVSGTNYDVFGYLSGAALALELYGWSTSGAGTSARAAGGLLTFQNGLLCRTGQPTRRYLGTIRGSSAGQIEDSVSKRYLWNAHNQVIRPMRVTDATNSWSYATATWRQANGAATNQVDFVVGLLQNPIRAQARGQTLAGGAAYQGTGIGVNSTTANSATLFAHSSDASIGRPGAAFYNSIAPASGYNYLAWLEIGNGTTNTWYGDNGATLMQTGLMAEMWG